MGVKMGWIQIKMGHPLARDGSSISTKWGCARVQEDDGNWGGTAWGGGGGGGGGGANPFILLHVMLT